MKTPEELVSSVLGIPVSEVKDGLQYQSVPEWDSLRHIDLMLALEAELGVEITADAMVELASFAAIRDFMTAGPREARPQ